MFAGARVDRDTFMNSMPTRVPADADDSSPETRRVIMDMLIGGMMGERLRKMRDLAVNPPPVPETATAADTDEETQAQVAPKTKPSLGDRIAEDVRRDLEKMERQRAEKEARKQQQPPHA